MDGEGRAVGLKTAGQRRGRVDGNAVGGRGGGPQGVGGRDREGLGPGGRGRARDGQRAAAHGGHAETVNCVLNIAHHERDAAGAAAGCDRLAIGHADGAGRQRRQGERHGRVDGNAISGRGRFPQRVGGRDGERLGPGGRGRAGDGQRAAAPRGHGETVDGVLDVAHHERDAAGAAAGRDRLAIGHADGVGRQGGQGERDGRIDGNAVGGRGCGPQRVGGRDGERLGPGGRGRARDGERSAAAGGHGETGDGVLDVAHQERDPAGAAAGRDRLVVGHTERVGRQRGQRERDGRVDRNAVGGRGGGPQGVGGRDGEGLGPRGRGRARDAQRAAAAGRDAETVNGVSDVADHERDAARAAAGRDRLAVGHADRVGRQRRQGERDGRVDRNAVGGRGCGPQGVGGRDGERLGPRGRGRARDDQRATAAGGHAETGDGVLDVADHERELPVPPLAVIVWL